MKLYYAAPSPFSRKVRVLARELGLTESIEEIAVHTTPVSPAAEVTAVNPTSRIPTLVTDDGSSIYDSAVICEYLQALASPQAKPDGAKKWKVLTRQSLIDALLDACLAYRYEVVLRPSELHWKPWLDAQLGKIHSGLTALAHDLPAVGRNLEVDAIAAACALGWLEFRMPELDWKTAHPSLLTFYESIASRPSMLNTHPAK